MSDGKKAGLDFGLLILRLALGGIFIAHGVGKLLAEGGVNGFANTVANLGLPAPLPMAYAAVASELGGGLLVVLGLLARLGALSLAGVMVVAIVKVHWANGFFMKLTAEKAGYIPNGYEYCLALLAMALCVLFAGPGKIRVPIGKPG